jgi:two-component system, response regulator YesN
VLFRSILNLISNTPAEYRITNNEVELPKPQYIFRLFNQCKSLLEMNTLLEEILVGTTLKIHGFNKKSINMILQKAIDYIQNNYQEAITLNEVSAKAFVSPFYLSRMFTKELDKNFVDYLSEVRVQKAKEFLKGTSHKTYEIAEMVGIKDSHYFSKIFKKYTGLTPSEYRMQKPSV